MKLVEILIHKNKLSLNIRKISMNKYFYNFHVSALYFDLLFCSVFYFTLSKFRFNNYEYYIVLLQSNLILYIVSILTIP